MKAIEEFVLNSTYGNSCLSPEQIQTIEEEIHVFLLQVRLERGKEPSFEELNELRRKVARNFTGRE